MAKMILGLVIVAKMIKTLDFKEYDWDFVGFSLLGIFPMCTI
jgi:hypothetical protein